jgi:general stress protein 26
VADVVFAVRNQCLKKERRNHMANPIPKELKEKIMARLTGPTLCALATVTTDGLPWVRYVMFGADENLTLWGATFASSRKAADIRRNPEVHVTTGAKDMETAQSFLQIQARAEILTDAASKKAMWTDYLKGHFSGPDDPEYVVCKLTPYRIEHHTMDASPPEAWEA